MKLIERKHYLERLIEARVMPHNRDKRLREPETLIFRH